MKNLFGEKFGRWKVVGEIESGKVKCSCECGTERIVNVRNLLGGRTKSCGCFQREIASRIGKETGPKNVNQIKKVLPKGVAIAHGLVANYRTHARNRGLDFSLTTEQFLALTISVCFYCKAPPAQIAKRRKLKGHYIYNGVDRLDNTKGYTVENSVPCCRICNRAKSDLSLADFVVWLERVKHNYNGLSLKA